MGSPEYVIVGRIRKAHGIRGELAVEPITDAPDAIFAPGRRVFVGTLTGDIDEARGTLEMQRVRVVPDGLIVAFREITDRTAAETWRGRYLLLPESELEPPEEDEVYVHDLLGMTVVLPSGESVGAVRDVYELPQGLVLDVAGARGAWLVPYIEAIVIDVDVERRVVTIDPPEGLLD